MTQVITPTQGRTWPKDAVSPYSTTERYIDNKPQTTTGIIPVNRRPDDWVLVMPAEGSAIRCSHCNSVAACVSGDNLIVVQRHHGQYHKTVFSLTDIGFSRDLT